MLSKNLFKLLADDYNLVYVIQQICNQNRLTYYVSVSLIWAALYRYVNQKTKMFRMHKINDLIELLDSINLNDIEQHLNDIHRFLTLISVFQSLVILRKPRYDEYGCFKSFFKYTESDINLIKTWLERLKDQVERICAQRRENENCLQIIELLDLDILSFMRQTLKEFVDSERIV